MRRAGTCCAVRYIPQPYPPPPNPRRTNAPEFGRVVFYTSPVPDQPTTASPTDSDQLLVERAVAGDERAYELLVIKYQRRIERLIGRMVRDVDLVPDIA